MHKVFINDKPLIFEDVYNKIDVGHENFLILSDEEFEIDQVVKKINKDETKGIVLLCARPELAWTDFAARYVLIEAAGGVVKNENDDILVIYRKEKWDLPKGKLEYSETPEEAALREVKEECGIDNLEAGDFLMKTFHTYSEKNKSFLKKTHWFCMTTTDTGELVPQLEEDIEKARWMDQEKIIRKVYPDTYASIKEVLSSYFAHSAKSNKSNSGE